MCTLWQFDEVTKAVAECAFVCSEMPVILSLEMHCSPRQQRLIAEGMCSSPYTRKNISQINMNSFQHNRQNTFSQTMLSQTLLM